MSVVTRDLCSTNMLRVLVLFLALLLKPSEMSPNKEELNVVEGNNLFTTKLYNILAAEEGNVFFSPISVHAVLSMALQGAQGSTLTKMATALAVPGAEVAAKGYNSVMTRLNSIQNVTLHLANKVFLNQGSELLPEFGSAVKSHFLSEVQLVNFAENQAAAKTINDWVEEKTKNKIKDLIQKDDLDELTRLVLVNAIYFKGNWKHKFDANETRKEPFFLNEKDQVDVDMMHIKKKFFYKADEALDAQILELPYTNEDVSMVIVLPNKINGIVELEKKLKDKNLSELTKDMYETEVIVALPKFKIEKTIDLGDTLNKLGLEEIFDARHANFRGMIKLSPNENLYVSKVIQKAFIEVNEEGAEAAAATESVLDECRLVLIPIVEANRPFIFMIVDEAKTNPLVVGRMSNVVNTANLNVTSSISQTPTESSIVSQTPAESSSESQTPTVSSSESQTPAESSSESQAPTESSSEAQTETKANSQSQTETSSSTVANSEDQTTPVSNSESQIFNIIDDGESSNLGTVMSSSKSQVQTVSSSEGQVSDSPSGQSSTISSSETPIVNSQSSTPFVSSTESEVSNHDSENIVAHSEIENSKVTISQASNVANSKVE